MASTFTSNINLEKPAQGDQVDAWGTTVNSNSDIIDTQVANKLPLAGGQMSGNITMAGTETVDGRDLSVDGTKLDTIATNATAVGGANGVDFNDDVKARFGSGNDLEIFHDDSGSDKIDKIVSTADFLRIQTDTLRINSANGSQSFIGADLNGSVDLKFQDNIKLSTSSGGVNVVGTLSATTLSGALPYSDLTGTPTIPTNNVTLTNGAGYVTSSGVTSVATGNGLSGGTITSTGTLTMSGSYSGSFSASSNITAYSSDERLKNFRGKIENPLDKINQLNGYYYEWNDLAKRLDGGKSFKEGMEVGVNAQEVEKVLPECVTTAPIVKIENLDTDYKTVYYDRIVPLLIEGIKELKTEIDILKGKN